MCNFLGHRVTKLQLIQLREIEKQFGSLAAMQALEEMKSGFEYGDVPVVKAVGKNDFEIVPAHWEFIPVWIKTMEEVKTARKQGIPWLNATSEKLLSSKMFRDAALKRRCLVIASYFFEWRHFQPQGAKKSVAYPYVIDVKDRDYFFMAGIYNPFTDRETGETFDSVAIVTTKANELMECIHNTKKRMPVILPDDLAWRWIMEDLTENEINDIAAYRFPSEQMQAHTIAKDFKTSFDPCEPFTYEDLPALNAAE